MKPDGWRGASVKLTGLRTISVKGMVLAFALPDIHGVTIMLKLYVPAGTLEAAYMVITVVIEVAKGAESSGTGSIVTATPGYMVAKLLEKETPSCAPELRVTARFVTAS